MFFSILLTGPFRDIGRRLPVSHGDVRTLFGGRQGRRVAEKA